MSPTSAALYQKACQFIPGGVNSPVRAFKGVGGTPLFISKAKGAHIYDSEGRAYIDYVGSWGPMIAGHADDYVLNAVSEQLAKGLSYGAPTKLEIQLAEKINQLMPSIEMVRMVNSGTEATMSALRLARGFTKRDKILKFAGCYHGHSDALLVQAGSGVLTCGIPSSAGVPSKCTEDTLVAEYNNLEQVAELFARFSDSIAAIIVEPVAGNMNCVLPEPHFLSGLRQLCDKYGSILIFDEVMTGFRVAKQGAQGLFNIKPDLTTLGKVIGGGMPVGAFGGRRDIMQHLAPLGQVYQAGTLSGNPIAMAAGLATLDLIDAPGFYENLTRNTNLLISGLKDIASKESIPFITNHVCGMFGIFFNELPEITRYSHVSQSDVNKFNQFFHAMLDQGVYLAPSAFEAGFVSSAHTKEIIEQTLEAARKAFQTI